MGQVNQIQHDFTAGELTPFFRGRSDQPNFSKGGKIVENLLIKAQGPLVRRPPTKFIVTSINTGVVRLEPVQPNADEGFILEISNLQIRILRSSDDTIVLTIATTYTDAEIDDLRLEGSIDVVYITHEDHPPAILERITDTNWTLTDIEFKDGPFIAQTPEQEDITLQLLTHTFQLRFLATGNPFAGSSVGEFVEYKQQGIFLLAEIDTILDGNEIIVSPVNFVAENLAVNSVFTINTVPTPKLLLSSISTFTTELENSFVRFIDKVDSNTIKWVKVGKYRGFLAGTVTLFDHTEDGVDDSADAMNVIVDPVTFVTTPIDTIITEETNEGTVSSDIDVFSNPRDVGRFLRLFLNEIPVVAKITTVIDDRNVTVSISSGVPLDGVSEDFLNEGRTKNWRFGAFYTGNFPRAVALFQQRFWLAGTKDDPEAFWGSIPNKFFTFSPTDLDGQVLATSAIAAILDGVTLNKIRWMHASQVLFIGTEGAEFRVSSSGILTPITPLDIIAINESKNGSSLPPIEIGGTVLFLQLANQKLREFEFSFQVDKFVTLDISILSDHIFSGDLSAVKMSYQKEPNSVLWLVRSDGQLVGLTFIKEQEIRGWSRHIIGGPSSKVKSVATVRHSGLNEDITYVIVERVINGSTVRYLEKIDKVFIPATPTDDADMIFVDSFKKITGPVAALTPIAGFDHLEGEEVEVVTDGGQRDTVTVSGGSITLPDKIVNQSYIGFSYLPITNLYVPEASLQSETGVGTNRSTIKRIDHIATLLIDSLGISIGPARDQLSLRSFRTTSDPQDNPPPFRTQLERIDYEGDYEFEGDFFIAQEQPYPFNLAAVIMESGSP